MGHTDLEVSLLRRALIAEDVSYRLRLELAAERAITETQRVLLAEMSERLKAASIGILTEFPASAG